LNSSRSTQKSRVQIFPEPACLTVLTYEWGRPLNPFSRSQNQGCAPFDFIFIDADKQGYPDYLEWSLKLSRPGTVIVADNVVRDGKVVDAECADPNVQGVRRFTELLAADHRVSTTVLQTVGAKGYDGFALAVVLR
jgi:predicted O-methyltransferase YrrM